MTNKEIMLLLCQDMLLRQNIDKFYWDEKDFIRKEQQLKISYIEEISIKSYQISENYSKTSTNYLAMITWFV